MTLQTRPQPVSFPAAEAHVRVSEELVSCQSVVRSSSQASSRAAHSGWAIRGRSWRAPQHEETNPETIRERTPTVRKIEHTIEYLDLVGSCHQYVATLGRLVP
nr:DUF6192 family protein [Streptomyces sp. MMBL 11-1]